MKNSILVSALVFLGVIRLHAHVEDNDSILHIGNNNEISARIKEFNLKPGSNIETLCMINFGEVSFSAYVPLQPTEDFDRTLNAFGVSNSKIDSVNTGESFYFNLNMKTTEGDEFPLILEIWKKTKSPYSGISLRLQPTVGDFKKSLEYCQKYPQPGYSKKLEFNLKMAEPTQAD